MRNLPFKGVITGQSFGFTIDDAIVHSWHVSKAVKGKQLPDNFFLLFLSQKNILNKRIETFNSKNFSSMHFYYQPKNVRPMIKKSFGWAS